MGSHIKPLHFQLADGTDLYMHPISDLLSAVGRKDRETIVIWENKEYIPVDYVVRIKTKRHQVERYYTGRTIRVMRKWFSRKMAKNSPKYKFSASRIARIHKLFKEEYETFQGAKYVGRISRKDIKEKRVKEQSEKAYKTRHVLHDEWIGEDVADARELENWSIEDNN